MLQIQHQTLEIYLICIKIKYFNMYKIMVEMLHSLYVLSLLQVNGELELLSLVLLETLSCITDKW